MAEIAGVRVPSLGFGPDSREPASRWWLFLLHGLLAIAAGALLLAVPDRTLLLVALVFGVYLIVAGIGAIGRALTTPGLLAMERSLPAIVGMLAIGAGIIVLIRPAASVLAVALAAGVYLIVAGLEAGVAAIQGTGSRGLDALRAAASIAAGMLVIAWPEISAGALALVLGIYLVVRGAIEVASSVALARRV